MEEKKLSKEWLELVDLAMESGISKEIYIEFLKEYQQQSNNQDEPVTECFMAFQQKKQL